MPLKKTEIHRFEIEHDNILINSLDTDNKSVRVTLKGMGGDPEARPSLIIPLTELREVLGAMATYFGPTPR